MKTTISLFGILTITAALAVQVQAQTFLTNGLVAYYPFNGNANDTSGYLNNPVLNTAILTTDRFNLPNSAYSFSGTQDIQYADSPQLDTITNLTVSCWVKTTNTYNGFYGIVCKATGSNPWVGFQVGIYQNHAQIEVDLLGFSGAIPINDGKWHSICAVFDHANSLLIIFVDGVLDTHYSTPETSIITPFPLYIGAGRGGVSLFTGSIDEVRIYNRALATNEVAQLFALESPPIINIQKAVYLTSSNLWTGSNYQVQASSDLINWTNQGSAFTATTNYWHSTNYWDVPNWSQLFFRVQLAP